MTQRPVAIGLLLCEQIIIEDGTHNVTPVNCFTHRTAAAFPCTLLPFVVLAILTDGVGEIPLEVLIQRLDTFDEVYRTARSFQFTDPLQEMRCTVRIRTCSFPLPGPYLVSLLADNEMIAQRKLVLSHKETSS
jgi:hypothetical protein